MFNIYVLNGVQCFALNLRKFPFQSSSGIRGIFICRRPLGKKSAEKHRQGTLSLSGQSEEEFP